MSSKEFEILNNKIAGYLSKNVSLKKKVEEKDEELGKLKKDISAQRSKVKKLTDEKKTLKGEIDSLKEELAEKK